MAAHRTNEILLWVSDTHRCIIVYCAHALYSCSYFHAVCWARTHLTVDVEDLISGGVLFKIIIWVILLIWNPSHAPRYDTVHFLLSYSQTLIGCFTTDTCSISVLTLVSASVYTDFLPSKSAVLILFVAWWNYVVLVTQYQLSSLWSSTIHTLRRLYLQLFLNPQVLQLFWSTSEPVSFSLS